MDPDECLKTAIEAIRNGDYDTAKEHLSDLQIWMEKGGFWPKFPPDVISYLGTALWSSTDYDGFPLDDGRDWTDCTPKLIVSSVFEVTKFLAENLELIEEGCCIRGNWSIYEQAGHDFWLTRNYHGAGFWDGDWEEGDKLTEACRSYPEIDLYLTDEGKVDYLHAEGMVE